MHNSDLEYWVMVTKNSIIHDYARMLNLQISIKIHNLVIKISHTVMQKPLRNVFTAVKGEYGRWGNILLPLSEGCVGVFIVMNAEF